MKAKTIKVTEEGFVNIEQFDDMIDVSRIEYYETIVKDGNVEVKFYDSEMNLIVPYVGKKS